MEMLHIPPAQPKAETKPAAHSKADKPSDQSFPKLLEKSQLNGKSEPPKEPVPSAETDAAQPRAGTPKTAPQETEPTEETTGPEDVAGAEIANQVLDPALPALQTVTDNTTETIIESTATPVNNPASALPATALPNPAGAETAGAEAAKAGTVEPLQNQATTMAQTAASDGTDRGNHANGLPLSAQADTAPTPSSNKSEKDLQQAAAIGGEMSDQAGLMENSLSSLVQDVRPLRNEARGRLSTQQTQEDQASIAIGKQAAAKLETPVQNQDSLDSFLSEGQNGFSAAAEGTAKGIGPMTSGGTFDAVLENGLHSPLTNQQTAPPLQMASSAPGALQLANGQYLSEQQVVNQVIERLSFEQSGDQSRIVIKMNPEELGEVKLSLVMEKDQLRAQLLTQNQQVQEILEKHLPKLHEALAKQGLKLDEIQVGVDSDPHAGRESFARQRRPDSFRRVFTESAVGLHNDPLLAAAAAPRNPATGGLSLRI